MKKGKASEYILTLTCPDRRGIVRAVSGLLADNGCNILDSAQFSDPGTSTFFMRVHFADETGGGRELRSKMAALAAEFELDWRLHDAAYKPRLLLMVSKAGHCLNDLLYRYSSGLVHADVRAVVSNHEDFRALTESHGIAFHHLPVSNATRPVQEAALLHLIEAERIELVVLARYMQVLSPELSRALRGRAINIHHSFLPSFKGAHPYGQAHARGVKLIGATAHFVTDDLDEGPIIEQDVSRVGHAMSVKEFAALGRDVESVVLARAVDWFVQHRILPNGDKTIVFR
ncbi:MAG: formyltetrahydrofolate deformylase [Arenimonas sp.]